MKGLGKFLFGGVLGALFGFLVSPKRAQRVRDALLTREEAREAASTAAVGALPESTAAAAAVAPPQLVPVEPSPQAFSPAPPPVEASPAAFVPEPAERGWVAESAPVVEEPPAVEEPQVVEEPPAVELAPLPTPLAVPEPEPEPEPEFAPAPEPEPVLELEPQPQPPIEWPTAPEPAPEAESAMGETATPSVEVAPARLVEPTVAIPDFEPVVEAEPVLAIEPEPEAVTPFEVASGYESAPEADVEDQLLPREETIRVPTPSDLKARIEETRRRIQEELEHPFAGEGDTAPRPSRTFLQEESWGAPAGEPEAPYDAAASASFAPPPLFAPVKPVEPVDTVSSLEVPPPAFPPLPEEVHVPSPFETEPVGPKTLPPLDIVMPSEPEPAPAPAPFQALPFQTPAFAPEPSPFQPPAFAPEPSPFQPQPPSQAPTEKAAASPFGAPEPPETPAPFVTSTSSEAPAAFEAPTFFEASSQFQVPPPSFPAVPDVGERVSETPSTPVLAAEEQAVEEQAVEEHVAEASAFEVPMVASPLSSVVEESILADTKVDIEPAALEDVAPVTPEMPHVPPLSFTLPSVQIPTVITELAPAAAAQPKATELESVAVGVGTEGASEPPALEQVEELIAYTPESSASAPSTAGDFDHDAMRKRIEETRNRLKAKAFDAMMSGEASLLARDSETGSRSGSAAEGVGVDAEVDNTIESTLTEEDL